MPSANIVKLSYQPSSYYGTRPVYYDEQQFIIYVEFTDATSGALLDPIGLEARLLRPDRSTLVFASSDFVRTSIGKYELSVIPGAYYGVWRILIKSSGPAQTRTVDHIIVQSTGVEPAPDPTPVITTDDLKPLVTVAGGVLSAQRISALPALTSPSGLILLGVKGSLAYTLPASLVGEGAQLSADTVGTLQQAMSLTGTQPAGSASGVALANDFSSRKLRIEILAQRLDGTVGGKSAMWSLVGLMTRAYGAGSAALIITGGLGPRSPDEYTEAESSNWRVTFGIASGALVVDCLGTAGATVRWNATVTSILIEGPPISVPTGSFLGSGTLPFTLFGSPSGSGSILGSGTLPFTLSSDPGGLLE